MLGGPDLKGRSASFGTIRERTVFVTSRVESPRGARGPILKKEYQTGGQDVAFLPAAAPVLREPDLVRI